MIKADIDKLLESTVELAEDIRHLIIRNYEIDLLLDRTKDWE